MLLERGRDLFCSVDYQSSFNGLHGSRVYYAQSYWQDKGQRSLQCCVDEIGQGQTLIISANGGPEVLHC